MPNRFLITKKMQRTHRTRNKRNNLERNDQNRTFVSHYPGATRCLAGVSVGLLPHLAPPFVVPCFTPGFVRPFAIVNSLAQVLRVNARHPHRRRIVRHPSRACGGRDAFVVSAITHAALVRATKRAVQHVSGRKGGAMPPYVPPLRSLRLLIGRYSLLLRRLLGYLSHDSNYSAPFSRSRDPRAMSPRSLGLRSQIPLSRAGPTLMGSPALSPAFTSRVWGSPRFAAMATGYSSADGAGLCYPSPAGSGLGNSSSNGDGSSFPSVGRIDRRLLRNSGNPWSPQLN